MYKLIGIASVLFLVGLTAGKSVVPPLPDFEFNRGFIEQPNIRADDVFVNHRLPNETEPIHYEIEITSRIDKGDFTFSGKVSIEISVKEDTSSVTVHAANGTNFKLIQILDGATKIETDHTYEVDREFLTITPKTAILKKGKTLAIYIEYESVLRTSYSGFYIAKYDNVDGTTHYLGTTQFESADARHAFPCYDEPAKRATFKFSFIHSKNYNAVCNTIPEFDPVAIDGTDTVKTSFKKTTSMSTYITAFIISDFEYTEGRLRNLTQRVYSKPHSVDHQEFALTTAMQLIAAIDDYLDYPFENMLPSAKLDQVAVPQFSAGAMENWGLTTYREEYLLFENGVSPVRSQTNIANILGHEDIHQWFGDLVAIQWWEFLWVKESFAQYLAYVSNDLVYPEWNNFQYFYVGEYQSGMNADSRLDSRPMTYYVNTRAQIGRLYDSISYAKGASVLRMMSHAFTEKVFKDGLAIYLKKYQFQTGNDTKLFDSIQTSAQQNNFTLAGGATIKEIFGSWTSQAGHPLLTVTRNYQDGSFTIKQERYYDDSKVNGTDEKYYVPFNYATKSNPDFRSTVATYYLKPNDTEIRIDAKLKKDDWLILNKQTTGFYKIKYDDENYRLLSAGIRENHYKFHDLNRAALIFDANKLATSERLNMDIVFDLLAGLENDDEYPTWATASSILRNLNFYLKVDETDSKNLHTFIRSITANVFSKLGVSAMSSDRHYDHYLRSTIMDLVCISGDEYCLEETSSMVNDFVEKNVVIESNLKTVVLCNGMKDADDKTFDKVYNVMKNTEDNSERSGMMQALGCAQKKEHQEKFVNSSLDNTFDKDTDKTVVLRNSYSNGEVGLLVSIDFLNENYKKYSELQDQFGGENPLSYDLRYMPSFIILEQTKDKYFELVKKIRADAEVSKLLSASLEVYAENTIQANMGWNTKNKPKVSSWLKKFVRGGASQTIASSLTIIIAFFVTKYLL